MTIESQNKMLNLLSQAYGAVNDVDKIDNLMAGINDYLFEDDHSTVLKSLPDYAEFDPHLEQHIQQLNQLMSKSSTNDSTGLSMSKHAQLIFADDGQIITANSHARTFLNGQYTGYIDDMPFSVDGIATIKQLIMEISAGIQNIQRVIYLRVESEQSSSAFGYCRIIPIGGNKMGLHIALSYFEWSEAILLNLENALGLSTSEGLVLQGVLKGQTRLQIAEERGRSISTIKAQANTILQKANCSNMNELAHLCTSIAYVASLSDSQLKLQSKQQLVATPKQSLHMLPLKNGRELAYYEYGDPNGHPVLFFHGFYQGPFFLDDMKRKFLKQGLRIIAPSRPHFGYSHPPSEKSNYIDTVDDDMQALFAHLQLSEPLTIVAHHAGGSFAFRFAKKIQDQLQAIVLVGAGIPITDEHIKYMTNEARMASVASRHAPSIMRMFISLAIKNSRKKGMEAMLDKSYAQVKVSASDNQIMQDKTIRQQLLFGLQHLVEQGAEAFVHDGRAQMLDWTADYNAIKCKQTWIMGRDCPIMGAHFVEEYVTNRTNHSVEIIENAGYNILFQSFDLILESINKP